MNNQKINRVLRRVLIFSAVFLSITWQTKPINLEIEEVQAQTAFEAGQTLFYGEKEINNQTINLPKIRVFKKQDIVAPVTDPQKTVTDPVLLKELERQGIDKDYVELFSDYAPRSLGEEHSPYAQFYRDLKSGKRFMVTQGLPIVTADGRKIEPGWDKLSATKFRSKVNLFLAEVEGNQTTLTTLNDQPSGAKKGNYIIVKPQLFLNGKEELTQGNAALLTVDPVNENYKNNVLEWDYGICKRRIRIIEGRFLGSWVFESNPGGDVRIKYNQKGDYKLKLGQFKVNNDEELVPKEVFDKATYPFEVSDSATYYPDADPESTSVDGYVAAHYETDGHTWATIIADPGYSADDSGTELYPTRITNQNAGDDWRNLFRAITLFDTSALPDNATITGAVLSVYGYNKMHTLGGTGPDVNVYSSAPASNTALAAGDFDSLGSTAFCDTAITYAGWNTGGYNDFTFNSLGIAAISKTGVSKFGLRNANYDVAQVTPPSANKQEAILNGYTSEQGTDYKPKLVVTYTIPPSLNFQGINMQGIKVD